MEFSSEVWWFIVGVVLVISEMFISGFFVFWFGVSALLVSVLVWAGVIVSPPLQVIIWASVGGLIAWVWFRAFKPKEELSTLGDAARAAIGRVGVLGKNEVGEIVAIFEEPLLGQRQWPIVQKDVSDGEEIEVVEVVSNRLKVKKTQ